MDFKALVTAARTCRRFVEDSPLHMSDLEWLMDCARLTPSARNAQVLRYVLITGRMVADILPLTVWAGALKDWGGPHPGERPTGFLALLVPDEARELTFIDAGIAAQTVQLAATSRGWGCCIIASFQKTGWRNCSAYPRATRSNSCSGSAWQRRNGASSPCRRTAPSATGGMRKASIMCPSGIWTTASSDATGTKRTLRIQSVFRLKRFALQSIRPGVSRKKRGISARFQPGSAVLPPRILPFSKAKCFTAIRCLFWGKSRGNATPFTPKQRPGTKTLPGKIRI